MQTRDVQTRTERWPRGLMDPPECPVCGGTERDPESIACWHCKQGHYADCRWIRDVAAKVPFLSAEEKRVWKRLTEILPNDEVLRRLGKPRPRFGIF